MSCRLGVLSVAFATLAGCSYEYQLLAVTRDGGLVFIVDPDSSQRPSCLRTIEVIAEGSMKAQAEDGDDASRVGYGTFWFETVRYEDDCKNRFPLQYGSKLKGQHQLDFGTVRPKPLLREVVYEVSSTTGATGYGGGRFVIRQDGQIENLPRRHEPSP